MSIGASAISGMTMGRLHAVMGSRWRRTARIASKSAFLARRRDGAVWTARTGQTERGPQQMLTDAQQHATDRECFDRDRLMLLIALKPLLWSSAPRSSLRRQRGCARWPDRGVGTDPCHIPHADGGDLR